MKKLLPSIFVLCMLLSLLPTTALAAAPVLATTSPVVFSGGNKVVTITFETAIEDATNGSLKSSVTLATDGNTYKALDNADTVAISGATLVITLQTALSGADNRIKVAAGAVQASDSPTDKNAEINIGQIPAAPKATIDYFRENVGKVNEQAEFFVDTNPTVTGTPTWSANMNDYETIDIRGYGHVKETDQYIHIRTEATDTAPAGLVQDLKIPARPKVTLTAADIFDYVNETVTIPAPYQYQIEEMHNTSGPYAFTGSGAPHSISTYIASQTDDNLLSIYCIIPATASTFESAVAKIPLPVHAAGDLTAVGVFNYTEETFTIPIGYSYEIGLRDLPSTKTYGTAGTGKPIDVTPHVTIGGMGSASHENAFFCVKRAVPGVSAQSAEVQIIIPCRGPEVPATSQSITLTKGDTLNRTKVNVHELLQYMITASDKTPTDASPKQAWTVGTGAPVETTCSVVAGDLVWIRSKPTLEGPTAQFAGLPSTSGMVITSEDIFKQPAPFEITSMGTPISGGVGLRRTISCRANTATPMSDACLVVQTTMGSGNTANVSLMMVKADTTVEISYKVGTTAIQAWLTDGMPTLNGSDSSGAAIYDTKTAS